MPRRDVRIPAPDGHSHGTLHVPDGDGPWPGVLVFPDAGGVREMFGQMGNQLAGLGYAVLIPDIFCHASTAWPAAATTTMWLCGGSDHDDVTLSWFRGRGSPR